MYVCIYYICYVYNERLLTSIIITLLTAEVNKYYSGNCLTIGSV